MTRAARQRGLDVADGALLTAHDVIELAGSSTIAREILDEILDMVAMAVAALSVILDPQVIVVGSGLSPGTPEILTQIEERLTGRILRVPTLRASALGQNAVLLGAAELAISEVDSVDFVPR